MAHAGSRAACERARAASESSADTARSRVVGSGTAKAMASSPSTVGPLTLTTPVEVPKLVSAVETEVVGGD